MADMFVTLLVFQPFKALLNTTQAANAPVILVIEDVSQKLTDGIVLNKEHDLNADANDVVTVKSRISIAVIIKLAHPLKYPPSEVPSCIVPH